MVNHVEGLGKVRTKIVATVGPASRDPEMLRRLVDAGVDVFRLNFSHGTHEEHAATYEAIREVNRLLGRRIAILQDLCGPKIRLGDIVGDVVSCDLDAEFTLWKHLDDHNDPRKLTCTYEELADDLEVGQSILFADGAVAMDVVEQRPGWVRLKVTLPGRIRSHQGINVPGAALSVSALTEKDLGDLEWTIGREVSYVGLSFVRQAADVTRLRAELDARGSRARIVAKIEKPQAVANLECDRRRGRRRDGGAGRPGRRDRRRQGPGVQKQIIDACHRVRDSGDHGHPDAQQHGIVEPADAGRGDRRIQRRARRHRRGDALGRDGHRRSIPSRRSRP